MAKRNSPELSRTARGAERAFAARVRIARRWAGLSRAQLAAEVGVTASAASLWEHPAGTMPSVENLTRIARATETAFEWLATGRGEARANGAQAPAADFTQFAHDLDEEHLLASWRRLPRKLRALVLTLIEGLGR